MPMHTLLHRDNMTEMWLRRQMAYDLAQVRPQKISVKSIARRALTDDLHP